MLKLMIILFTLMSCKDKAQYKSAEDQIIIIPAKSSILSAKLAPWGVGTLRRQEVSKGISVKLEFPTMVKSDLENMITKNSADSWLIRVKRRTLVTSEILKYFYVPFLIKSKINKDLSIKQIESGFIYLYYSAAAKSPRFERFRCPIFNHSRLVDDFEVVPVSNSVRSIQSSKNINTLFTTAAPAYDYKPVVVNAGKILNGEYLFEVALFDAKNKFRKSNWYLLNEAVKVTKEEVVKIKGCKDFKIPESNSELDNMNDFKFGK